MFFIDAEKVHQCFNYKEFIPFLRRFLANEIESPDRAHFSIPVPGQSDATLLTMPSWSAGNYFGVKVVSVFPENTQLPTINGTYLLMDGNTGAVCCAIDGLSLTVKRTAAVSALAGQLLASKKAATLLMIGTGNLCHELIRAHASAKPLTTVWIWGRNYQKARSKANTLILPGIQVMPVEQKEMVLPLADIVSAATLSQDPLILGKLLKKGFYLDLVGSFKKDSREADNDCFMEADIFVDTYKALDESGDLYQPLQEKVIEQAEVRADLTDLCKNDKLLTSFSRKENTFFKSVGFAGPDLAAAVYLYEQFL